MTQNRDEIALIAYYGAINNFLREQKRKPIHGDDENKLVIGMFNTETNYLECAKALIELRKN